MNPDGDDSFSQAKAEIQLCSIQTEGGRDITYSVAGPSASDDDDDDIHDNHAAAPILFFYPGGANRRMLLSFAQVLNNSVRFICVNRPGKGGTSPAAASSRAAAAVAHLDATVRDSVAVLDHLGVRRVKLMCMCAGAPFAMAFALQHKERCTGDFMGISVWVPPADCGRANTKLTLYLGSRAPRFFSPIAGSVMSSVDSSLVSFPTSWVAGALRSKLSKCEREVFDRKFNDKGEFKRMMQWMQVDKGGQGIDVQVLLSEGLIDYEQLGKCLHAIHFWHGTNDSMTPYTAAQWLADRIPGAMLNTVNDGSHDGGMFLLHSSIVDALMSFAQGHVSD